MAKASDIQLDYAKQSILLKSPPGFGKTLAAASFALEGPVYLSYWDKRTPVELVTFFRKFGDKGKRILDNIEWEAFSSHNANEYLNKLIKFSKNGCSYTALINDSLTYMTSAAVNWSLNFGKSNKDKDLTNVTPSWDEYKVETSLVSQCIDLCKAIPVTSIWTAHPMPSTKVEGSGGGMKVTKTNSLVSYGSKVAGMVPGGFTEIYHLGIQNDWDSSTGTSRKKYICHVDAIGDEFAKSPLLSNAIKEFDFTDKLFYEVWKEMLQKSMSTISE